MQIKSLSEGRLQSAGILKNYIIISINNIKVNSAADVEKVYRQIMKSDDDDKLLVLRGLYPSGRSKAYLVNLADE